MRLTPLWTLNFNIVLPIKSKVSHMTDLCLGQVSWTGRIPKAMVCIEKQEKNCSDRDSKTV